MVLTKYQVKQNEMPSDLRDASARRTDPITEVPIALQGNAGPLPNEDDMFSAHKASRCHSVGGNYSAKFIRWLGRAIWLSRCAWATTSID